MERDLKILLDVTVATHMEQLKLQVRVCFMNHVAELRSLFFAKFLVIYFLLKVQFCLTISSLRGFQNPDC